MAPLLGKSEVEICTGPGPPSDGNEAIAEETGDELGVGIGRLKLMLELEPLGVGKPTLTDVDELPSLITELDSVGIGRLKLEPGEPEEALLGSASEVENVGAEPGILGGSTKLEPDMPDDELMGRDSEVENVGAEPGVVGGSTKLEPCEIGGGGSDMDMDMDMPDALMER
jgi:hypothetical protein